MSLQYLDALKAMGAGPSTKFIFPMEFAIARAAVRGAHTGSASGENGQAE